MRMKSISKKNLRKKKATLKIILDYKKIKWGWNQKKNIIQWIIPKKNITKNQGLNKK
jgi:hypothetical protein